MSEIYEKQGTVTLVNGVGVFRYKLMEPNSSIKKQIDCAVLNPVNKSLKMLVNPGDVAPPVTPETFDVTTSLVDGYMVYDVVSNLMYSDTSATFAVKETSVDVVPTETFTITSSKSGNNVILTVRSSDTSSAKVVNVTITEYRPGSPITVIKTQTSDVTLASGVGSVGYAIYQTQPPVDQRVEGKITATPSVITEVTVPRYVAPLPPKPDPRYQLTTSTSLSNVTATTGSGTATVTFSGNLNDSSDNTARIITVSGNMHGDSEPHVGNVTCSPASFSMTRGQSRTYTFTWSLTNKSIKSGRIVSTASMDAFNQYTNAPSISVNFKV